MANEFMIESRSSTAITVRHVAHGHRYSYGFKKKSLTGVPILCGKLVEAKKGASRPATLFCGKARAFAEREARKAGLID
jgi:hypothetical protein